MSDVVAVDELTVVFPHPEHPVTALDHFSMRTGGGEVVGIVGPSGSGKTTLLSVLSGMLPADGGRVMVGGLDVLALTGRDLENYRREMIGIVFQGFNLMNGLTAQENVALPLLVAGVRPSEALARAAELLGELGLHDRRTHRPAELSGGQKQRVAVARGLVNEPVVLLADEPTANLDRESADAVVSLLHSLRDSGRTVLVSTHDDRVAAELDQVITLGAETVLDLAEETITLAEGQRLYRVGDPAPCGFVVLEGTVELSAPNPTSGDLEPVAALGEGERFGELEALLECPRASTAVARGRASVQPLSAQQLTVHARRQPI